MSRQWDGVRGTGGSVARGNAPTEVLMLMDVKPKVESVLVTLALEEDLCVSGGGVLMSVCGERGSVLNRDGHRSRRGQRAGASSSGGPRRVSEVGCECRSGRRGAPWWGDGCGWKERGKVVDGGWLRIKSGTGARHGGRGEGETRAWSLRYRQYTRSPLTQSNQHRGNLLGLGFAPGRAANIQ